MITEPNPQPWPGPCYSARIDDTSINSISVTIDSTTVGNNTNGSGYSTPISSTFSAAATWSRVACSASAAANEFQLCTPCCGSTTTLDVSQSGSSIGEATAQVTVPVLPTGTVVHCSHVQNSIGVMMDLAGDISVITGATVSACDSYSGACATCFGYMALQELSANVGPLTSLLGTHVITQTNHYDDDAGTVVPHAEVYTKTITVTIVVS